jgi:hypothetical protein
MPSGQSFVPYRERVDDVRSAAEVLKAGAIVDTLTTLGDGELLRIIGQLEAGQRCLRAVLRERAAQARREAALVQKLQAAGIGPDGRPAPAVPDASTSPVAVE